MGDTSEITYIYQKNANEGHFAGEGERYASN